MQKTITALCLATLTFAAAPSASATNSVKKIEQTICFSKEFSPNKSSYFPNGVPLATLGDDVKLYGGKCNEKTLPELNKEGWRLIQVVAGLQSSFGMVLEK